MKLVNTSHSADAAPYNNFPFQCQPDCSVYERNCDHKAGLDFSLIDIFIEFKTSLNQDPFSQKQRSKNPRGAGWNPLMSTTSEACRVGGQIVSYATTLLGAQYRTHAFSVIITGPFARLIRWDRSGAIVTEQIEYETAPFLFDFLLRYDIASKEMRGHDCTVSRPRKEEEKKAREFLGLADAEPLLSITMPDLYSLEPRNFIFPRPCAKPNIPAGRCTRTSIAYDVKDNRRVLLKDSWRVVLDDIEPEGRIYLKLAEKSVPNIPVCVAACDVGEDSYHSSQTDKFTHNYRTHPGAQKIVPHRHYRLVLATIGKKLHEFDRSKQMLGAVHAALLGKLTKCWQVTQCILTRITAHQAACKAGILHRDISANNIMIVDTVTSGPNVRDGILIDWDLSKAIDSSKPEVARQFTRTVSKVSDVVCLLSS